MLVLPIVLVFIVMCMVNFYNLYTINKTLKQEIPNSDHIQLIKENVQKVNQTSLKEKFVSEEDQNSLDISNTNSGEKTLNDNQHTTQIVDCVSIKDEFPQEDTYYTISGTNLDQLNQYFQELRTNKRICKQQLPIGTIIPFIYYPEDKVYEIQKEGNKLKPAQLLKRESDNLLLIPLLGGILKKEDLKQSLGEDHDVIKKLTWIEVDNEEIWKIPNSINRVLKSGNPNTIKVNKYTDEEIAAEKNAIKRMNMKHQKKTIITEPTEPGKLVQTHYKIDVFNHQPTSENTKISGYVYTGIPSVKEIKRSKQDRIKGEYDHKFSMKEHKYQDMEGTIEVNIQDPNVKTIFCMVLGYY